MAFSEPPERSPQISRSWSYFLFPSITLTTVYVSLALYPNVYIDFSFHLLHECATGLEYCARGDMEDT